MTEPASYRTLIEAHAVAAGLTPTPEQIEVADTLLQGRIQTFTNGVALIDGVLGDPAAAIAEACAWFPRAATPPAPVAPPAPTPPAPPSRWTGLTAAAFARTAARGATVATVAMAAHDAEQVDYARRLAVGPNPFKAGGNHTHRAFIIKYLPDTAAQLKVQAGS